MIRLGVPQSELGPVGISKQKMRVEKRMKTDHDGKINDKLYQLMKEERYTDVTLQFDDGKRFSCHRCVLASSSDYFDCMFSNGMRESSEDVVEVVGVTSAIMAVALEFMYTGQCECVLEDFFDLLLLANMYELKELERGLVDRVVMLDRDRGSFLERGSKTRDELEAEVLDFLIEVWVFCRRYPVIAGSLQASISADTSQVQPFKDTIVKSLGGSPRCNWGSKLVKSENLMSLDYESFRDFLTDTYFTDHNPKLAFDVASAWLTHKSAPKSATKSEMDLGEDMDLSDAPPESRLQWFEDLMGDLRLRSISKLETLQAWGVDSLTGYRDRIEDLRQRMNRWNLLIMSLPDGRGSVKFMCHNMETGKTFRLDPPTYNLPESELYGMPKLMIQDKSVQFGKEVVHSLYCVRGVRPQKEVPASKDTTGAKIPALPTTSTLERLCFIRHEYSFTRKQWFLSPDKTSGIVQWRTAEEKVPLNCVEFLVPHISAVNEKQFPLVRLSHDYAKKPEPEESTEKVSLETPPPLQEKPKNYLYGELLPKNPEEDAPKDVYTDEPSSNMAEVFAYETGIDSERNHWQCRVPNFEVLGVGVYKKKHNSSTGVALFGNAYAKEGLEQKETLVLLNAIRKRGGFPEGICESPLSVLSLSDYIFVVPSSPYVVVTKKGKRTMRLPKVYVFNPHGRFAANPKDWVSLPTPTCPDIDYASLYYDAENRQICLVLVQRPLSDAPLAAFFKSSSNNNNYDPMETRSKQSKRGGGSKKKPGPPTRKEPPIVKDGRVVARYRLLLSGYECFTAKKKKNLSDVWRPMDVSGSTADFLALGSKAPGEVRILSTPLNINNLTIVDIDSIEGGRDTEEEEETSSRSGSQQSEPWVNHQHSLYQDLAHTHVENKVNHMCTQRKDLLSVRPRHLVHPMMSETPLKPSHPTIKYKMTESYSTESLNRENYEYSDYDDDDYGSSESDYYVSRGFGGGYFDYEYGYDSDPDVFDVDRYLNW